MKKTSICSKHDDIYDLARQITKFTERDFDDLSDALRVVSNIADDIMTLAQKAKEDGQHMESRLIDYRDAIEGLGFVRKK